ncbi:MFS transporter [Enterococcus gilvus]|uniref:MFS transporter n=1 Tax=Enterococcus gilvus TaxID=160453 RepID=UPI003ED8D64D
MNKKIILYTCCISLFIVTMDVTVVNIALPSIQSSFNTDLAQLQWINEGYTLVVASFLLLSGSTADKIGRKKIFEIGLTCFCIASFLCGVAQTTEQLIAFRVVQGIGGSMLNPVAMSIITNVFTGKLERAKAVGLWGSVTGISLGVGPILGGLLVTYLNWRYVFFINIPIIIVALVLTRKYIPESKGKKQNKNDIVGQILMIIFLFTSIYSIVELPKKGMTSLEVISTGTVGILTFMIFIIYEKKQKNPLVNPNFFVSIPFTSASVIAILGFTIYSGFLFLNTLYLQNIKGLNALSAGLLTIPLAVTSFVVAPKAGKLVGYKGTKLPFLLCGSSMFCANLLEFYVVKDTSIGILFLIYILLGIGFGMLNAPITITAVNGMPSSQSGTAAAIAVTCKQIGNCLGVALPSLLINTSDKFKFSMKNPYDKVWNLFLICSLLIILLGYFSNSKAARKSLDKVKLYLQS